MTFDNLKQIVFDLTGRPDLIAETETAVRAATLKAHRSDFYAKDIYETIINAETPAHTHSIDYPSVVTNFRALKYLRKVDALSGTTLSGFIDVVTPEEIMDTYGRLRTDIAYTAGRVIEVRSSTVIDALIFACYVDPVITEHNYASWVAVQYPYAIIYEAARVVFKTTDEASKSAQYRELVMEEYNILRQNSLPVIGS